MKTAPPSPSNTDDDGPEMDTVWTLPPGAERIFADAEAHAALIKEAFATGVRQAIEENDRLGIPSYGSDARGRITVRRPRKPR